MDPEQLRLILGYALFVAVASVLLRRREPDLSRIKIAFFAGGLLPSLGLALGLLAVLRWVSAGPLPNDTDHQAMAIIGIVIMLLLSLACLVVGMILSLVVTAFVRAR
jgi:hypothetical protein